MERCGCSVVYFQGSRYYRVVPQLLPGFVGRVERFINDVEATKIGIIVLAYLVRSRGHAATKNNYYGADNYTNH